MKKVLLLSTLLVFATVFVTPAFAHSEEHIQTMRQAADALKSSNADLSKKLNDYADKEEKEHKEWKDNMAQKGEDIQKIRNASEFLQGKNDDLAKDLKDVADRWDKKMQEKEKKM